MRTLSEQQAAVVGKVGSKTNIITISVAGSGKTTLGVEVCRAARGSVAFVAYNTKAAAEISSRLEMADVDMRRIRAGTFHKFGFGAWRRVAKDVKVDPKKLVTIMAEQKVPEEYRAFVGALVSQAKQRAIGIVSPMDNLEVWRSIVDHFEMEEMLTGGDSEVEVSDELMLELLRTGYKVLRASIARDREVIDFDDMIFAPLIHNIKMWQNDLLIIDEAQDTNPARRVLGKKMLKPGGQLFAIGDPRQAIYGFTGADADALDLIRKEFGAIEMPLTVTYRCPKAVVAHAQQWVSHIVAHDSAPEGIVREVSVGDFEKITLEPTDAILCRNTKPLVELAFQLIRKRIACHVEGREIGNGLLMLANKWKKARTIGALRKKLEEFQTKETEKLMTKGSEVKAAALVDKVDTLKVLMEGLADDEPVEALRKIVADLFKDTEGPAGRVTLSTVHKSKGREWDRVFLWGRNRYMPSPYARQDWQLEQEDNLIYVAVTRAKQELVEIVVPIPPRRKS